jgi:hypothetical protein
VGVGQLISSAGQIPVTVSPEATSLVITASSVQQLLNADPNISTVEVQMSNGNWQGLNPLIGTVIPFDTAKGSLSVRVNYKGEREPQVFTNEVTKESKIAPVSSAKVIENGSVTTDVTNAVSTASESSRWWLWLVIALGALLLFLVVGYFVKKSKK